MKIKAFGIVSCGKLAEVVVQTLVNDLLPNYRLTCTMSRKFSKAQYLADKANSC